MSSEEFGFKVEHYGDEDDSWWVYLPHSCDEWVINSGTKEECAKELAIFIREAQEALTKLLEL